MSSARAINVNHINPVDWFNRNKLQHTIDLLMRLKNIQQSSISSLTYVVNKTDETLQMICIEDGCFVAKMENGLNMPIGEKFTPFMMMQRFVHKGSFSTSLSYVIYDLMNTNNDYIRVGTKYFKKIVKIDRYKVKRTELKPWDRPTIIDDHGKDFIEGVEKFFDFTIEPDNKNYRPVIDGNYNVYSPFDHIAMEPEKYNGEDDWCWINNLLKHIFGDQYELGLRYLKVLYDHPRQALPILVLISEERQTGKTTFIDFLNILFGANTVVINPQDINNSFNSTYADKNIIMIEESHFDSKQATEKLKNLSTQKKISVNTKFVAQHSLPFFGKIIITSNDEDRFSKVDDPEIRYWVRKIPTLVGKENHNILEDMSKEIPAFLCHLNSMEDVDLTKSRMVFNAEELKTEELLMVKEESKVELHKEIEMYLDNHALQNSQIRTFYFVALDIKNEFFLNNNQIKASYVNKILRSSMKLEKKGGAKRYVPLEKTGNIGLTSIIGKPYVYHNKYFGIKIDESIDSDVDPNDIPF